MLNTLKTPFLKYSSSKYFHANRHLGLWARDQRVFLGQNSAPGIY
jgi:hypothetical protein